MKKKISLILFTISFSGLVLAHPVHVSIVNISLEGLKMNITISTFVDDWETSYFHYFGDPINLKSATIQKNEWFQSRMDASFILSANNDSSKIELLTDTIYFNDFSMILEMHAQLSGELKSLYIYNAILTDIFADQTNLLIFSTDGKEKGIKFDYKKQQAELKLR